MSFGSILYSVLIMPLEILFQAVYAFAFNVIRHPGLSIIALSLVMNILLLPLYRRADALQEEERNIEMKLAPGVKHIKKTFRGDEQMLILQTYYRQNNYKPTSVLRSGVSLFLQIPFFMAAYHFLSNLPLLQGSVLGPITDLGRSDQLLTIAGFTINVLPVIMTLVNIASSFLFSRDYPLKTKIQLYGLALFFLVFLYNKPAGLVFYWTLNNCFSLIKNVFYKLKDPRRALRAMLSVIGIGLILMAIIHCPQTLVESRAYVIILGVLLQLPLIRHKFPNLFKRKAAPAQPHVGNSKIFTVGCCFLAVLTGILIPSAFIATSPQEFVVPVIMENPLIYIVSSASIAIGIFVVWFGVFYRLSQPDRRWLFDVVIWVCCGLAVINYLFFGKLQGLLNTTFQYEDGMFIPAARIPISLAVCAAAAVVLVFAYRYLRGHIFDVLVVAGLAICVMSVKNCIDIRTSVNQVDIQRLKTEEKAHFDLSRNGKNVVVVMLDRAMGEYIPYIMEEKPELKEAFAGFTYYGNTVSFGAYTNYGTPGIFGGYEYTPIEMNKRDGEPLADKHNEALKVMPAVFGANDYQVTVCDPPYAGYQQVPDLSIYDGMPNVKTYNTSGKFSSIVLSNELNEFNVANNMRNAVMYGIMRTLPPILQRPFYMDGLYCTVNTGQNYTPPKDTLHNTGISPRFADAFPVLENLPAMTDITDDSNTLLLLTNKTTHEPMLMVLPDYHPSMKVDSSDYASYYDSMPVIDGKALKMETVLHVTHYQTNVVTMIELAKWFDYLRANDVYDNTRIILVSDHGRGVEQLDDAHCDSPDNDWYDDTEWYRPLLMVKDFGASQYTVSDEFMTNADVPTIVTNGLIDNAVNPFTGKALNNSEKTAHKQYVIGGDVFDISENNGNTFKPARWYTVNGDSRDVSSWEFIGKDLVLQSEING